MAEHHDYTELVHELRTNFNAGLMKTLDARLKQLHQFHRMMEENEEQICAALYKDLKKCKVEALLSEIYISYVEVRNCIKNLEKWMKAEKISGDILNKTNLCELRRDPLGVVLIIGAWNYPYLLAVQPMVGAIGAGNCVILKPSELSVHTAQLMGELIPKYLNSDCIKVINGGIPETTALLRCRFDHILYTGGTAVGKIVMRAASEYLTPVTLELGGKNPTIVDSTCDFDITAQRISFGKFLNNGQTCLAVDYIMCIGGCQQQMLAALKKAITKFFGKDPKTSDSYGRIVNKRHFQRIVKYMDESIDSIVFGNIRDEDDLYISPTIMTNVAKDNPIMQEEIFGPIIILMEFQTVQDAIKYINEREKPLAIYVFSKNNKTIEMVKTQTSSGGMCINDCLGQFAVPTLPFGGVGHSGMGAYHGKHSFDTFSHKKSVLQTKQALESLNAIRYAPYDPEWKGLKYLRWIYLPSLKKNNTFAHFICFCLFILGVAIFFPQITRVLDMFR